MQEKTFNCLAKLFSSLGQRPRGSEGEDDLRSRSGDGHEDALSTGPGDPTGKGIRGRCLQRVLKGKGKPALDNLILGLDTN
jgi:hypothetical protein